jgi:hypothetical protein
MTSDKINAVLDTSSAIEGLGSIEGPEIVSRERQLSERAGYGIIFTWIRTALRYAAELLKDVALFLTVLYFLGVVAICVAILFYTFCR